MAYAELILKLEDSDNKILTSQIRCRSILLRTLYQWVLKTRPGVPGFLDFSPALTNFHLFFAIVDDDLEVVDGRCTVPTVG